MSLRIKLLCECCRKVHDLPKTPEIPEDVTAMACNFCIECEDKMNNYYEEWLITESELPPIENPDQLKLFDAL